MRLRFALWKTEAKLLGVVLFEALVFTLLMAFPIIQVTAYFSYLWRGSLATFFKYAGAGTAIAFAAALYRNLWSALDDPGDEPLREPLRDWPALESAVRDVARELKRAAPDSAALLLSPVVWRRFGCDLTRLRDRRTIPIPASYLGVWPVLSLRCHIGHALIRRRPKTWLFYAVRKSLVRLARESRPKATLRIARLKPQPLTGAYLKLLVTWGVLADMEADARIARIMGGSAVATWICQTQLAGQVAPLCLRRMIQPAAERGVLLPIAASCAAFYGLIEPGWLATVEGERVKAQRSNPANPFLRTLLMRLAVLPGGPASVHDPRPAATLLHGLDSLEERLLRHEAALGGRELRRAAIGEIGEAVVLPMMREEVDRNAPILEGRSVADLPGLLGDMPALAAVYRTDPRYLLGLRQRQALIPGLLAAFLAVELERSGWRASYTVPPGLTFERDGRTLCPHLLVTALRKGDLTREAFLKLVNPDPA
jgi:hypothetical protein